MTPAPPVFDDGFRDGFEALLRWRRDVRRFRPDPVPDADMADLLRLADMAPSVGLSQPWRFVTVDDPARRAAVRAVFARCNAAALDAQAPHRRARYAALKLAGLDEAPRHVAVFAVPDPAQGHGLGRRTMPDTVAWSAVTAIHSFWLAARVRGLGVGWVSILDPDAVHGILDVDRDWRLIAYLCVGHPAEDSDVPALEVAGWDRRRPARWIRR